MGLHAQETLGPGAAAGCGPVHGSYVGNHRAIPQGATGCSGCWAEVDRGVGGRGYILEDGGSSGFSGICDTNTGR